MTGGAVSRGASGGRKNDPTPGETIDTDIGLINLQPTPAQN